MGTAVVRSQESEDRIKSQTERRPARSFQDLVFWQKAHQWVLSIYKYTNFFPKDEMYGLVAQFRRAAVSVPANIAEGFRRRGELDKKRFMNMAQGSLEECRYYLILSRDLGYGNSGEELGQLEEISKLLDAYCRSF